MERRTGALTRNNRRGDKSPSRDPAPRTSARREMRAGGTVGAAAGMRGVLFRSRPSELPDCSPSIAERLKGRVVG